MFRTSRSIIASYWIGHHRHIHHHSRAGVRHETCSALPAWSAADSGLAASLSPGERRWLGRLVVPHRRRRKHGCVPSRLRCPAPCDGASIALYDGLSTARHAPICSYPYCHDRGRRSGRELWYQHAIDDRTTGAQFGASTVSETRGLHKRYINRFSWYSRLVPSP